MLFFKIIILVYLVYWNVLTVLMLKNTIFQILYIIVGPLCPSSFSTKPRLPSTVCSDWPLIQCIVIGRTPQAVSEM